MPCYYLFTQVLPNAETPETVCDAVAAGDDVSVVITNAPYGSSTFVAEITDPAQSIDQSFTLTAPTKRDQSAECVVQLPPGKVGPTPLRYSKLADFVSVSFTNCTATATQNAGDVLDMDQLATGSDGAFTVTALTMKSPTRAKASTVAPTLPDPTWSVIWVRQ
jgi:hypothetical protein